ncbi:MAG: hypothetical protein ABI658_13950 [Acidimicrobiales bacterium]
MNETNTTQIQFPSPGQRRRLVIAAIAATVILSTAIALGQGTNEHRATPRVYLREAVEMPAVVLDTEAPETALSDWELQAAIDDFCVSYRHLFDVDSATGERPLPRGCTGAAVSTGGEASVDFELGIDNSLTVVPR